MDPPHRRCRADCRGRTRARRDRARREGLLQPGRLPQRRPVSDALFPRDRHAPGGRWRRAHPAVRRASRWAAPGAPSVSEWERIFKDPMTTAAAVDRLVHHSVILELNLPSYRMEAAKKKKAALAADSSQ